MEIRRNPPHHQTVFCCCDSDAPSVANVQYEYLKQKKVFILLWIKGWDKRGLISVCELVSDFLKNIKPASFGYENMLYRIKYWN